MKRYKLYTTKEQTERLLALGVPEDASSFEDPAFTLSDLLGVMPPTVRGGLFGKRMRQHCVGDVWHYVFEYEYMGRNNDALITYAPDPLDAAVEMVVKLIECGYLKFDGYGKEE